LEYAVTPEQWIMWGTGIILVGTITGTSLVTFGNISAMRSSRNTANAIKTATSSLQQQTEKLETLNRAIAQKSEEIGNLASESLKQITGGDSFCIIHTVFSSHNNITLLLQNNGNYHIHDVIVQLQDSADSEKYWEEVNAGRAAYPEDAFASLFSTTKTIQKGTVFSNSSSPILTVPYNGERRTFMAFIFSSNGSYRETITVLSSPKGPKEAGYQWVVDAHLFRREGGTEVQIWEQVSDDFPRDSK
jgi:hypothetical protein